MAVAGISFIFRWIADFTCSSWSQTCRASSEILSHVYMVVFFFLVIVASTKAKQISDLLERVKTAYRMLTDTKDKHDQDSSHSYGTRFEVDKQQALSINIVCYHLSTYPLACDVLPYN